MAVVHINQRAVAMSRIPQTNYATPTVIAASAFNELLLSDQNLGQYSVRTQDNTGYSTRNDFPTDQWLLSHDFTRQFELDLASDPVGRILRLVCGQVSTSQPDAVGAPLVYRHVFVPQDPNTSRQLPATSVVEQLGGAGGAIDHLYPSCVVENLSLRGEGINRIKGSFGVRGSGKRTKPSGVTWATHVNPVAGWKYFFNSVCELIMADAGTLSNAVNHSTSKRLESWSLDYTNNLLADEGYRPGSTDFQTSGDVTSGAVRSELLFGSRSLATNFVTRLDAASDEYGHLQQQRDLDWKVTLTGPIIQTTFSHKLTIRGVLARYQTVEYGNVNGIVTLGISPKLLWDPTANKIVEFTLDNTVSSYVA